MVTGSGRSFHAAGSAIRWLAQRHPGGGSVSRNSVRRRVGRAGIADGNKGRFVHFAGWPALSLVFSAFPNPMVSMSPGIVRIFDPERLLAQALSVTKKIRTPRRARYFGFSLVAVWLTTLLAGSWLTVQSAKQLKLQARNHRDRQPTRNRHVALRDHAAPGDAVLLESHGYIGYFSGLKTYDVPGLCPARWSSLSVATGVSHGALSQPSRVPSGLCYVRVKSQPSPKPIPTC